MIALVVMVVNSFVSTATEPAELTLSEFEDKVAAGQVVEAIIKQKSNVIEGELTASGATSGGETMFEVVYPDEYEDELTTKLLAADVSVVPQSENPSLLQWFLTTILPYVLIFGIFIFILMQLQGGGNRVMSFGKAKAKQVTKDMPKVTFGDVAGLDEAVEELQEIKEFLASPQKFRAMGAKIPKGVLLYGPPGTGKTLLARAVAGEAAVPFFSISGSDFVEMFVGVGASRVRDLFEQAKAAAPAIIFIDEIDAVGRHRGAGLGGGHDEREQTLNQLLVEMDGFDVNKGVILIAATNRPDILDPALLRPGRFDRQVVVDRPDREGRELILAVHAKGKPLADDIDLAVLARETPGFTGADLANLINEGALLAARHDKESISMVELEEAIERVVAGPERKSRVMSDDEKNITAYHEGGHALVGFALPKSDPVHKVTIIPRGRAGGYTKSLPIEDRYYMRRSELVDQLAMMLGGRTAEEIVFGDPSTGASDDIEKATMVARKMVMEYGMSDRLGPMAYGKPDAEVFLGRDYNRQQDYSDEVASMIDDEVRALITQAHEEAREILTVHRDALDRLVEQLLDVETVDGKALETIFHDVPKWEHDVDGSGRIRQPSDSPRHGIAAVTTAKAEGKS
ncbi:MAG: ATP-dependent zinc metalloprotease FtsH [Acidimicrobiia bacterium]|nr:ATP-dependent zinc metalloprotease FtsH [Acidimicrobiia bacterium]MDH3471692.1 ATP-dependent zinc metalloprotease FtsH [Acidimicrobiia bacterium]